MAAVNKNCSNLSEWFGSGNERRPYQQSQPANGKDQEKEAAYKKYESTREVVDRTKGSDDAVMMVLEKIGLDRETVSAIKSFQADKRSMAHRFANQSQMGSNSSTTDDNGEFRGVNIRKILTEMQSQQPIDTQSMSQTVSKVLCHLPSMLQQELLDTPDLLDQFRKCIHENVKFVTATQKQSDSSSSTPQLSEDELKQLQIDRFLKKEKFISLQAQEERLQIQQRDMIKQMTKAKLLLESNPLLLANLEILSEMQNNMDELRQEIGLLEKYLGPRANLQLSEDLMKKAKELKSHRSEHNINCNFKFVDEGEHWCNVCDEIFHSISKYLEHLNGTRHIEVCFALSFFSIHCFFFNFQRAGHHPLPQLNTEADHLDIKNKAKVSSYPEKPVRGTEFVVPVTQTYFCTLCQVVSNGADRMNQHLKSASHYRHLVEHEAENPKYEESFELNKAFAYFAKCKKMLPSFARRRGLSVIVTKPQRQRSRSRSPTKRSRSRSRSAERKRSEIKPVANRGISIDMGQPSGSDRPPLGFSSAISDAFEVVDALQKK